MALSYFGTDQSQVQRYISGKNLKESQRGLFFNAILKVPMQFFILFIGISVFVFYQFNISPINFNTAALEKPKLIEELSCEGVDWDMVLISATWRTIQEEFWEIEEGHIFCGVWFLGNRTTVGRVIQNSPLKDTLSNLHFLRNFPVLDWMIL